MECLGDASYAGAAHPIPGKSETGGRRPPVRNTRRRRPTLVFGSVAMLTAGIAAGAPGRGAPQTGDETAPRPNIVVFLSDDMGWGQPGFNGGTAVPTPNIDRIANEGVKLTQFYAQPSCAPTRASLMTGRFVVNHGIRSRAPQDSDKGMPLDERTIAEALRDADYETWMVGKWHLGHWRREHLPLQRGFDHHYGHYGGLIGSFGHGVGGVLDWHRNGRPVVEEGYSTFLMADEASDLIERHDGASPFFLYVAFNAVHGPHHAPDEYLAKYGKPSGGTSQKAQLECMDVAVGQVIGALEAKGILDDTLVMFLNDNGGTRSDPNGPYRGSKGTFSEGGVRVPAVVRWPAQIAGGSVSDEMLHVVDLFPTFARLAGASTDAGLPLDGLDAWDTIANGAASPRTEIVFRSEVIRVGDWKLVERESSSSPADDLPQLFNISEDPYETTNLATIEPEKVDELRARLAYHAQFARAPATGAKIPDFPPVVYGVAENAAYGAAVRRALRQQQAGNPGPTLVRMEAAGDRVKLVYDEPLDTDSVPSENAFTVVVNPGYSAVGVTDVEVSGTEVLLTLDASPTLDKTVGLMYEVPDSGAIRDVDRLDAVGVTWVKASVSAAFLGQDATLSALSLSGIDIGTFAATTTEYAATVPHAISSTTVTATANDAGSSVSIAPEATVNLVEGANEITVTVTAADGTTVQTYTVTVTRAVLPVVSITAVSSPVTEGAAAEFEVTLSEATPQALTVAVSVAETGSMLSGTPPAWVTVPQGDTSAVLSVPTALDAVAEADNTVTASLVAGAGYVFGAATSASITVEDTPAPAGAFPRPNIVVFLSDDMGWGQPGFNGGTEVATPNMDRIANEGVKLTQFYVQPVCSPTRASLLTGRYAWKAGMDLRPGFGASQGMLTDERTIAEALGDAGYATWIVGKWHLGQWRQDHLPLQRGFDHHYGLYSAKIDSFTHQRDGILDWHRNGRPVVESGYSTFLLAEEAVQLIERHDGASPFFLYLPFNAVHEPFGAPQEFLDRFSHIDDPELRQQTAMFKAMDVAIGRVLDALGARGVLDETVVTFLNDNGGGFTVRRLNGPYSGRKSQFLEGGMRVPAVMRWPAEIPAGSENDALLHVADLFPTFARLAGADPHAGLPLDGLDVWDTITLGGESPRTEVVHSLGVIRLGDWKLIEEDEQFYDGRVGAGKTVLQLYNIGADPYETTNLAASESAKVAELQARLAYHAQFARARERSASIPNFPPVVYGKEENAAYGAQVERALQELGAGNPGPTLVRLEAVDRVKLVYDEALDTASVPPADAFTVVLTPGYAGVAVTDVAVSGMEVVLTLDESPTLDKTVGLTYEVPDSGAIRDVDRLDAVGRTWVTAPVSAAFLGQDATLSALGLSGIDLGTFSAATTDYAVTVPNAVASTTVTAVVTQAGAGVSISPGATVSLAEGANEITVTVTAADGTTVQTYTVTVTRAPLPEVSIAAVPGAVTEGAAAAFEVTLSSVTPQALTVAVGVTETGAMLAGAPPASVTVPPGATSVAWSVATAGDAVVEADSVVTASVTAGDGYAVGTASSASVTVSDDDEAAFRVSAATGVLKEGESAALTVEVTNGVTFAADQPVDLSLSGTASAADYSLTPSALTLSAGASSATAVLAALDDQEEEAVETVTVSASHGGVAIGAVTVNIESVSHDATLSALSLSGIEIGTFAAATTSYTASVPHATVSTTVTAAANHAEAEVSISPGATVSLAAGANVITVTVTAEDGTTEQAYTVTVTRADPPSVSIAAVSSPVTEGTAAAFTVTLSEAAPEAVSVAMSVSESGAMLSGSPPASVTVPKGATSATVSAATAGDAVVEADSVVTASVTAGTGYAVGSASSASVTVEDDDEPAFTVSVAPLTIKEGESATLTVAITSGVTFAEDQPVDLSVTGTASGADYSLTPSALTLSAGTSSATAVLAALDDREEEADETVTVVASHGGAALGSVTVTLESVSHDATLSALSLSGIDIGTFAAATTSYTATVPHATSSTTVTATANHGKAEVSVSPGATVSLAEGENVITVTVTAEDGTTERTYTVTVTRTALPVVSIAAVADRVSEGEPAEFRVSRTGPTAEALQVQVTARSTKAGSRTRTMQIAAGQRSRVGTTSRSDDEVVDEDVEITWRLDEGAGYRVSADAASATVVVEDDDEAVFAVSVDPAAVKEGASATLTVAVTNGVTFAEDQTVDLSVTGTASAGDYSLTPSSLALAAGAPSGTVVVEALDDEEEEEDETMTVAASHGGAGIGSVTVTLESVSHDATLSALSLSGIDIGTFSAGTTDYEASVPHATSSTTVTATANHAAAEVSISPGATVSLAEGENEIEVSVTAEDGTTTETYRVTVTRLSLPVVSITAVSDTVPEGEPAEFRVSRTGPTTEDLSVKITTRSTKRSEPGELSMRIRAGKESQVGTHRRSDDQVLDEDVEITWAVENGEGYRVSPDAASATVVMEENDVAEFTVSFNPATIAEGETATLRVEIGNGVTFAQPQSLALAYGGSATAGTDYTSPGAELVLPGRRKQAKGTVTAKADEDVEGEETVSVTVRHDGSVLGTATLTITNKESGSESSSRFSLAPENGSPSGLWSNGETAWVADVEDGKLYAYRLADGSRQPERDIATGGAPMGLWSDGATLWAAELGEGLAAYGLEDGERHPERDLAVTANGAPVGLWSDGETVWVTDWLGDTVHAYRLADGERVAARDIRLGEGNLLPVGLWSDGETLWVADWGEWLYAYRLSDGERLPERELRAGGADEDPSGLWSGGGALLATSWRGSEVRAYPVEEGGSDIPDLPLVSVGAGGAPGIPDPALRRAVAAALAQADGETTGMAELTVLDARNLGIRDLSGLEAAVDLEELDLGFNPLADLGPLAMLPALRSLNLDGTAPDLKSVARLRGLEGLSLRSNGIEDLGPLAVLGSLVELDVGDNRIEDLSPLAGLRGLTVLGADRNRIEDLWPLGSLSELRELDLGRNQVLDVDAMSGLAGLRTLRLGGNDLTEVSPLSGLTGLEELGLAGNPIPDLGPLADLIGLRRLDLRGGEGDVSPLRALESLGWLHVGGSGIEDLTPLRVLDALSVSGREDRESPGEGVTAGGSREH